ncbi:hypothetical protein FP73_gp078 [Bacillus phage Hoody T]|uniref:Uncharacterized protein n=3 Tax=Bastillevirus TaxID=1918010 RepID=A0A024B291_9CAUD|nr:hypothetical protein FP73_gp078 [Bacillus phage Hoody T]AHZ10575.1 hypothetical protein [Bacillus phage Hoody T]
MIKTIQDTWRAANMKTRIDVNERTCVHVEGDSLKINQLNPLAKDDFDYKAIYLDKQEFEHIAEELNSFDVPEEHIIYGSQLKDLSNEELIKYHERLEHWITKGWKHEGCYILQDYVKYEMLDRMKGANNNG